MLPSNVLAPAISKLDQCRKFDLAHQAQITIAILVVCGKIFLLWKSFGECSNLRESQFDLNFTVILLLRIWAIYNNNKKVLTLLLVSSSACVSLVLVGGLFKLESSSLT